MKLLPIDSPALIETVAGWLGQKENYQWLDFGQGVQRLTPVALKLMTEQLALLETMSPKEYQEIRLHSGVAQAQSALLWGREAHTGSDA